MPRTHYLPDGQVRFTWDTRNEPVLAIDSGDTVVVWTRDVSDNQIRPDSDPSAIAMIDHIATTYGLASEDAHLLCSLAVDLKISEIVDAGQYIVSALLPEAIFSGAARDG